jgi:hypothetical protein
MATHDGKLHREMHDSVRLVKNFRALFDWLYVDLFIRQ